jgi:LuxR family maltose regulon positive regulatory protein
VDGPVSGVLRVQTVTALLLAARARDALGDQAAAGRALEQALAVTAANGILLPFLLDGDPALLKRQQQRGTAHPVLLAQILDLLRRPARAVPPRDGPTRWALRRGLTQQLTDSETRVLRYLPTHLTVQDIANELCLSVNTVGTHRRHLYAKLGVHTRHEAVNRARTLGLLAPSARRA